MSRCEHLASMQDGARADVEEFAGGAIEHTNAHSGALCNRHKFGSVQAEHGVHGALHAVLAAGDALQCGIIEAARLEEGMVEHAEHLTSLLERSATFTRIADEKLFEKINSREHI